MHSVVCIKQVPDSAQIRVHPVTNTIMRQGVPAIINPYDLFALEEALRLKDRFGGTVTVICMGPPMAEAALRKCLSFGADDAILVSDRKQAQNVKEIVNQLKEKKRREADELLTTYRPWGKYSVLEEGPRYKIKKIVVNEGQRLSLQRHSHRSEHWVVVRGTAKVTIGSQEIFIHENESTYIPKSTVHRLENPGKIPLEIIEVQNGEYVGEDDIERLEDNYGRVK